MRKPEHILEELQVLRAQDGRRDALETLVELRSPKLLTHATRLLGNREDARDVVQDAWVDILRGLNGLREPRAFASWATRIVTRRCAKFIEGQVKRRELGEMLWCEGQIMPDDSDDYSDEAHAIRAAICALPPLQGATIALFYLEDMSVREVSVAMDVPIGTVKTRLMHARETLKSTLKGLNDDQA